MTPRLIAVDLDGTLIGPDGQVSNRNLAAVNRAHLAGIEVVVATGRRHSYAMHVLRALDLPPDNALISSNGTVTRTIGARLLHRTLLSNQTARWLCLHVDVFRNSLVMTFDKVGPDGEDTRGALVVEHLEDLTASIGRWMTANEPYIARVSRLEDALEGSEPPIQMMLCGTVERMRRAEARLLEHPGVSPGDMAGSARAKPEVTLHRTEYPERNLSIVDILPAGCSKASALLRLARQRGIAAQDILAIGDNWNDVPMLEIAGRAVLMGNAPEDLRTVAAGKSWTIGRRHDEDGVAEAIEAALETIPISTLSVTR
ncbi:MAG: HAD-IIB family hydrolase [Acidobacteriota bacterium]|nr:HAD-IIB family hydrolase [Acidobacteriota bacterium]